MTEEALEEREHARQGHVDGDDTAVEIGGNNSKKVPFNLLLLTC